MSVSVDRVIGYVLDVKKLSDELTDEMTYIGKAKTELQKKLESLDFVSYYNLNKDCTSKVCLFYDGMNDTYKKLVYVLYFEKDCEDYSDESDDYYDKMSELTKELIKTVPQEVRIKFYNVMKEAGISFSDCGEYINLETFRHWH